MRGWRHGTDAARLVVIQTVALLAPLPDLRQRAPGFMTVPLGPACRLGYMCTDSRSACLVYHPA